MRRLFKLIVFISVLIKFGYAQEFSGVALDGNIDEVVSKFVQKGFQAKPENPSSKPVISLIGYISTTKVELFISYNPSTKEVWRFSVYLPQAQTWNQLKAQYLEYRSTLLEKNGQPLTTQAIFSTPFTEGDGNEMNALVAEKVKFQTTWMNKHSISITKYKQVMIDYINAENYKSYKEFIGNQNKENF